MSDGGHQLVAVVLGLALGERLANLFPVAIRGHALIP